MAIKHKFVSEITDKDVAGCVRPSNRNDTHDDVVWQDKISVSIL